MPQKDIVVVGASAGGIESLIEFISQLPAGFPAAVFVVVHFPPDGYTVLPSILTRSGRLPALSPHNGDTIENGHIYVAPPDWHMELVRGHIELNHGPRENSTRPAIDPLFRSAAREYGPRVVGIVLSGANDDGTIGIVQIKMVGGTTIAQDPEDALFPSMPQSAIETGQVDYILPAGEIAGLLERLVVEPPSEQRGAGDMLSSPENEQRVINNDQKEQVEGERRDQPSFYTCPECGGVLWQFNEENAIEFRCHTGHIWSPGNLSMHMSDTIEQALAYAIRALKEKATLMWQLERRAHSMNREITAQRFAARAEEAEQHMQVLTDLIRSNFENGPEVDEVDRASSEPGAS